MNRLTSCVRIVEVGVQALLQELGELLCAPLLNILHKLLQVGLSEGREGGRETGREGEQGQHRNVIRIERN